MVEEIIIFRYGHRDVRDYRVTSHCGLVSRAFGASQIIICGNKDEKVINTLKGVSKRWGGKFKVNFVKTWEKPLANLQKKGFILVHLTMYGEMVQDVDKAIGKHKKVCIIIGSQKVERGIYEISDYNVSVTNQPHSEIAALSVFMDRVQSGKELQKVFEGAKRQIIPKKDGKRVIPLK
jgi:tRNA (cytidine56-2'-O)-methyltransferase